ncbi:hypothetical protein MTYP_00655 [Methylophilaceae bacterium]|nr:hypothetical protein MTYP_00655 [Methylophilaceae bacterium]
MHAALTRLRTFLPVMAFFAGFIWDALTIGRYVSHLDLWILTGYLACAGGILWWLGYRHSLQQPVGRLEQLPYLAMQFLFGGLFSALFIFYLKSASHILALLWSLGLAVLLVANEFIKDKYRRFTITWTFFGLCAILLFNFLLPFILGSIHFFWFYVSTLAGAGLAYGLRYITPGRPGRIGPVWLIAAILACAYPLDIIPPVPLVKRDIHIGLQLEKARGNYEITVDKATVWNFWQVWDDRIHVPAGERLYCVSSVFAPSGISTRLYHRWQYHDAGQGWVSTERIGFDLEGGRGGGFRGYTYKQNIHSGEWRVSIETEYGRTVAIHKFTVSPDEPDQPRKRLRIP